MRKLAGFINFIVQLLFLSLGVAFLYFIAMGYPKEGKDLVDTILYNYVYSIPAASILILLPLLNFFLRIAGKEKKKAKIFFENPDGKVSISDRAIIDFIDRICKNYDEVVNSITKVSPSRRNKSSVVVVISMDIMGGINIPETIEKLQQNIKRQLNELLGLENVESVEININKIISTENEGSGKEDSENY